MSIRPLILKDGVFTIPRSSTDISSLLASLGLNNVNNTSDLNKPISTATQTALNLKANLVSPVLTGTPTVPTATAGTNTTQAANCAFVSTAISNLISSSPATLDTLNELAAALGNDENFSTTITNSLANKVDLVNNQDISGNKYFLRLFSIGSNQTSDIQSYTQTDIRTLNTTSTNQIIHSCSGNIVFTTNPTSTFSFLNNEFEIGATSSVAITSTVTGGFYRFRNFGTGLLSAMQGLRLVALNSGAGNITTLEGATFTARNDSVGTTVSTLNGGSFTAQLTIGSTATTINAGTFLASTVAASTATTVRGLLINASSSNTTPATNCIGLDIGNITGTATNKFAIKTGTGIVSLGDTTQSTSISTGGAVFAGGIGVAGNISIGGIARLQSAVPGFWLDETDHTVKGAYIVLDGGLVQVQRRATNFGAFEATIASLNIITGSFTLGTNIASTSTITGTLVCGGGLGITGNIYAGGTTINFANLPTTASGLSVGSLWRNGNIINIV